MWIVAKVKRKEFNIFKQKLVEEFGKDTQFYHPKIQYQRHIKNKIKKFEKLILENYIFCYHEKFKKSSTVNEVKFLTSIIRKFSPQYSRVYFVPVYKCDPHILPKHLLIIIELRQKRQTLLRHNSSKWTVGML